MIIGDTRVDNVGQLQENLDMALVADLPESQSSFLFMGWYRIYLNFGHEKIAA